MKAWQGYGRKGPPQADAANIGRILLSLTPLLAFRAPEITAHFTYTSSLPLS